MKAVYISNYSGYRGEYGVQISSTKPDWAYVRKQIPELYPSWNLIKSIKDTRELDKHDPVRVRAEENYIREYTAQLERNKDAILASLEEGDVLLCWCARGSFCHRYIVQNWLKANDVGCREIQ